MCIQRRAIALILRCAILLACGYGLAVFLGLFAGQTNWSALVYYTNLSNLVCFAFYLFLTSKTALELIRKGNKGATALLPRLKGGCVMMITLTFLVYHFMLSGSDFTMMGLQFNVANIMLHYVAPIMIILDWLLFDKKGMYHWADPLLWLGFPYAYLGFALIRAEVGGLVAGTGSRYPYYFLDVDAIGASGVIVYVLIITAAYVALGYVFFLIDRIGKARRKKST